jgi:hypothetical protein
VSLKEYQLYFDEIINSSKNESKSNKLKAFLNVHEINIKLKKTYDYYYKLLLLFI